ncbi:protein N-terminal asparagine amidohydrolase-like [Diadema setosum]|uniref:protein N-terminal asparagine amidohydrolase-like n=1 Tax=Diadema setosum TaxID=31175 RepID=UPI003B3A778E
MPLLIEGEPFEWQPSMLAFIETYPQFKDTAEEFFRRQAHHCAPIDLLYVNQRELAVTHPDDNVVRFLGSDDATTCHIIVIRHTDSGATGLAHLDGQGTEQGIRDIITAINELSSESSEGRLEVHLFGGYCDEKRESVRISKQVLRILQDCPEDLHFVTACMSDLNDAVKNDTHWPTVYGIAVDVRSGEIFPATFSDKGPDQALRSVYTLFGEHDIRNIYDHKTGDHMITPFSYTSWPQAAIMLQQPDSFIRRHMSTSPDVEPPYFENHIRAALRWVLDHPNPAQTVFPGNKPRIYRKDKEGEWTEAKGNESPSS